METELDPYEHSGVTREVREAAAAEQQAIRDMPQTGITVKALSKSGNPKLRKLADQYAEGIISWQELESKANEIMKARQK